MKTIGILNFSQAIAINLVLNVFTKKAWSGSCSHRSTFVSAAV